MSDIITERAGSILRVELNRPAQKNAMTSSMYTSLADILNEADKDDAIRVVLWHAAGNVFCAGNDVGDLEFAQAGRISARRSDRRIRQVRKADCRSRARRGYRWRTHDANAL